MKLRMILILGIFLMGCVKENTTNTGFLVMKDTSVLEYSETNGIPICPYCQKPTLRTGGTSFTTLMYFYPIYNEHGENTNPDRNIITSNWHCNECGKDYCTAGNYTDGFNYIGVII